MLLLDGDLDGRHDLRIAIIIVLQVVHQGAILCTAVFALILRIPYDLLLLQLRLICRGNNLWLTKKDSTFLWLLSDEVLRAALDLFLLLG